MSEEKRMIQNYEVMSALRIGEKEVVFAKDPLNETAPFLCTLCEQKAFICYIQERYEDSVVSDDYLDIMEQYAKQILAQCQKVREERAQITVPLDIITADMCHPHDHAESIKGQVVAIKPSALRPEYRTADKQLVFITGGNGSMANHYGNACFAINLYTGKDVRWERYDVQGIVKDECLPDWAKEKAAVIREQIKNHKNKEVR